MSQIEIKYLLKKYGKKEVLHNVCCTLKNGVYGLLGPNGAGKTTLMRCITQLCSYQGEIFVNGKKIGKSGIQIGYLPQSFQVFRELTVWEMMQYFCILKKIPGKMREEEIKRCLQIVNLEEQKNQRAGKLSGGMLRRLGIAQAILGQPDLIILDEPTAGLDPEERLRFSSIINRMEKDCIVLISTHIVEDVEACCEKIIVMKQGSVLDVLSLDELRKKAENKVVERKAEESSESVEMVVVEKEYKKEGILYQRVLTAEVQEGALEPSVEDGYLYVLHQKRGE